MNQRAPAFLIPALVVLNLATTAVLAGWLISGSDTPRAAEPAVAAPVEVGVTAKDLDLDSLAAPIARLDDRLATLTTTVQRLNTSSIQYDFLESELEQLAALERGLILRGRTIESARTDENSEQTDAAIEQLKTLVSQVQTERQNRRQTLIALIAGLEKQLAGLSGTTRIADTIPERPAAVEPETAEPATTNTPETPAPPDDPAPEDS